MNAGSHATLTAERWQKMESIFLAALEIEEPNRLEFVLRSSGGDRLLEQELQQLLLAFQESRGFQAPASSPSSRQQGGLFGAYRIDRELGHGGMGTVYLAHRADGQFEQQVALKVVSAHLRSQFFAERFRTERQILAQLNHPNITRLLDGGVSADGDPYLVMEYVDGLPIHRFSDSRQLPVAERIRLFFSVCSAVEYAHRNLIVHRDLKPGNIFVTRDGVPKLLDFGTAKLLEAEASDLHTTRYGMLTPRYASPEQLRGEPITTVADVYSLGVLLFELVTGAWPFGDPTSPVTGLERAVKEIEPARPSSVITEEAAQARSTSKAKLARVVDGELRSIIGKAIEWSPERRYQSVEQLGADLERYLEGRAVLARPQTPLYRIERFVRRNWLPVTLAAAFILGLSAATAIAIRQAKIAREEATRAQAVTRFLQDVIYAGDPEDVKDRTVLQAMEIARQRLNDVKDPQVELSIRVALGYVYMENSLLPKAEKELRRAEALARASGNNEMLAFTLMSLANVVDDSAHVKTAYLEALEIAESKGQDLSPNLRTNIFSECGERMGMDERSARAEHLLREAVRIGRTEAVEKPNFITALSRLGQYLRYENRLDEAQSLLHEALGLEGSHPAVSEHLVLEELGAICIKRGDLQGAERYYRERRELMLKLAGPDNGTSMDARSRWAALEARLGHVKDALDEMRDNMIHVRKAFAPGSFGLWFPLATMAYILNQASQPAEALSFAKESLGSLGPTNGSDPRLGQSDAEVGVALTKLRRHQEAIPYLEDTVRIYSAFPAFGPSDYRTLRVKDYLDQARAQASH